MTSCDAGGVGGAISVLSN